MGVGRLLLEHLVTLDGGGRSLDDPDRNLPGERGQRPPTRAGWLRISSGSARSSGSCAASGATCSCSSAAARRSTDARHRRHDWWHTRFFPARRHIFPHVVCVRRHDLVECGTESSHCCASFTPTRRGVTAASPSASSSTSTGGAASTFSASPTTLSAPTIPGAAHRSGRPATYDARSMPRTSRRFFGERAARSPSTTCSSCLASSSPTTRSAPTTPPTRSRSA